MAHRAVKHRAIDLPPITGPSVCSMSQQSVEIQLLIKLACTHAYCDQVLSLWNIHNVTAMVLAATCASTCVQVVQGQPSARECYTATPSGGGFIETGGAADGADEGAVQLP
jgi:hypothetical protein